MFAALNEMPERGIVFSKAMAWHQQLPGFSASHLWMEIGASVLVVPFLVTASLATSVAEPRRELPELTVAAVDQVRRLCIAP